jgi:hypothetical protein
VNDKVCEKKNVMKRKTIHVVAYLLKARTMKPIETSVTREELYRHAYCWTMSQ